MPNVIEGANSKEMNVWVRTLISAAMQQKFRHSGSSNYGVEFIQRKLGSIEELRAVPGKAGSGYDFVVNCAGLGAAALVGDKEMVPIRGQVESGATAILLSSTPDRAIKKRRGWARAARFH